MNVTRRTLARILAATAAAPAAMTAQRPAGSPDSEADLNAARERMRSSAQQLDKVPLPMSTEPAVQFKA